VPLSETIVLFLKENTSRCKLFEVYLTFTVSGKRDQNIFCNIFYKTSEISNLVDSFLNKFAAKSYSLKTFPISLE